jgi:hypothetical protein
VIGEVCQLHPENKSWYSWMERHAMLLLAVGDQLVPSSSGCCRRELTQMPELFAQLLELGC